MGDAAGEGFVAFGTKCGDGKVTLFMFHNFKNYLLLTAIQSSVLNLDLSKNNIAIAITYYD